MMEGSWRSVLDGATGHFFPYNGKTALCGAELRYDKSHFDVGARCKRCKEIKKVRESSLW